MYLYEETAKEAEMTDIHFLKVGCGNMVLIIFPDDSIFMFDCNITEENEYEILAYLAAVIGPGREIDVFVNSHRDADHMRGIKQLNEVFPIKVIWDSGVPGTTTSSSEYRDYMELRRQLPTKEITELKYWEYGSATLRCMNSKSENYSDPNNQSIVLKVEDGNVSAMLAGDTSFKPWKEKILKNYRDERLKTNILLAAHHGSLSFFDDPSDEKHYYIEHIKKILPEMTFISVGPNSNDLPNDKAMELYEKYSSGSNQGDKLFTTEDKGHIQVSLGENGCKVNTEL